MNGHYNSLDGPNDAEKLFFNSHIQSTSRIPKNRHRSVLSKQLLITTAILLYGSAFLLQQINNLYYNVNSKPQIHHPIIASVSTSPNVPDAFFDPPFLHKSRIPLTFKETRKGTFIPERKTVQWIQTPTSMTDDSGDYVITKNKKYILKTQSDKNFERVLFEGDEITFNKEKFTIEDITFSDDLSYALIISNKIHNWRHSFFATYFIVNLQQTGPNNIQPLYDLDSTLNSKIALAKWSPDSKKITFILENNVYIKDLTDFNYPNLKQLTHDGGPQIFYGKPDWVYEEEVFESDTALWWSPNSMYLAILRSNDTEVPEFPIPYFVQDDHANDSYPDLRLIKYPKSGYPNPIVDLLVYDLDEQSLKTLPSNDPFYNDEHIDNDSRLITEVKWVGDSNIYVKITNRSSNLMKIFIVESTDEMKSELSRFENGQNSNSWFEISHDTVFIPKSETRPYDGYIDLIDVDGYDHIGYFSPPNAKEPVILTSGEWEVVGGASAFDFVLNKLYFISTEKSSIERHLYSVDLDGSNKQNITNLDDPSWYSASFSKGSRYLLLSFDGPELPYQKLIDLHTNSEELLTSNDNLKETLTHFDIPQTTFGEINLGNNVTVNYKETLPLNFNSENQYPLLFFVYGGPGSQLVQQSFSVSFSQIVAAELNAVVVTVDGRGTGFKGKKFRNIVSENLGHYEVIDQIAAAQIWTEKTYIDSTKTAIWGWSYGGYMTLKTIESDQGEVFKYGMSVAPVTDWLFYDSIYTERYMNTPQLNPNYHNCSVHDVDGFKKINRFLMMHGTGDDNVHLQNSLKLLDLFDLQGVENYDLHVFPDSDHGIRYHNAGLIVYDKLFNWLKLAFGGYFEAITTDGFDVEEVKKLDDDYVDLYG